METIKAKVIQVAEKHFIEIQIPDAPVRIPLSEDKPNDIKSAFNQLILHLKQSEFKIEPVEVGEDLISQVSKEYITQLNREIHEVREEMVRRGLVTKPQTAQRR